MLVLQEAISIPIAYIETFVMTLVAFIIGYIGAQLSNKIKAKRKLQAHKDEVAKLSNKLNNLQDELDRKADGVFRKDRMDEEFEHLQIRNRAFSEDVLTEKLIKSDVKDPISYERIGKATIEERNDLQKITGIGPYTEEKLNELGIYTFEQISRFNNEDILAVTKLIKFFPDRIKKDRWVAKAKLLTATAQLENANTENSKKKIMNEKTT
ncbi:hypothetical protein [uncultured Dokdonia sp.]|uniref:hypothetical protein n=1 Tax=uncultured Dokdonia sp. TaxID=575653 RepID=UPI00262FFB69|nr:hypothetical protein [uncultured Dokdonia sp.]